MYVLYILTLLHWYMCAHVGPETPGHPETDDAASS